MSERNLGVAYNISKRNSGKQYTAPAQEFSAEVDHRAEYERLMKEAEEHYKHFAPDEPEEVEEPAEPSGAPAPGEDRKSMIAGILAKRKA